MKINEVKKLDKKNVHILTKDGRSFTGYLNLAGSALIIGHQEYLIYLNEVSTIREV